MPDLALLATVNQHFNRVRFLDDARHWGAEDYWATPAEFFASGEREVAGLMDQVSRLGIAPARDVALDYGCGVGRLSRALAARFGEVLAIDHSESMLAEARRANAGFGNIRFMRNDGRTLPEIGTESVEFIYSTITLQHVPPDIQRSVIREFARVAMTPTPAGASAFRRSGPSLASAM